MRPDGTSAGQIGQWLCYYLVRHSALQYYRCQAVFVTIRVAVKNITPGKTASMDSQRGKTGSRTYSGEKEALQVIAWLEKNQNTKGARDVVRVLDLLNGMLLRDRPTRLPERREGVEDWGIHVAAPMVEDHWQTIAAMLRARNPPPFLRFRPADVDEVNKILRRNTAFLKFKIPKLGRSPRWFDLISNKPAAAILFQVLWANGGALLWKIRRCQVCCHWFFARQAKQWRCTDPKRQCAKKFFMQAEEWRAYRARHRFEARHPSEPKLGREEALAWYRSRRKLNSGGETK